MSCCTGIVFVPLVVTPVIPVGWVAVQLKVTPEDKLLKVTRALESPEQIVCGAGEKVTAGDGLTVTTIVNGVPVQFPDLGVIIYVNVAGAEVELIKFWLIGADKFVPELPPVTAPVGLLIGLDHE